MAKQGVRRKVSLQEPMPARIAEIPRIVRLLALAHRWHRLIDSGDIRDQATIARATGLTRARVTQIMNLRWLSPTLQAGIGELPRSGLLMDTMAGMAQWTDQSRVSAPYKQAIG